MPSELQLNVNKSSVVAMSNVVTLQLYLNNKPRTCRLPSLCCPSMLPTQCSVGGYSAPSPARSGWRRTCCAAPPVSSTCAPSPWTGQPSNMKRNKRGDVYILLSFTFVDGICLQSWRLPLHNPSELSFFIFTSTRNDDVAECESWKCLFSANKCKNELHWIEMVFTSFRLKIKKFNLSWSKE